MVRFQTLLSKCNVRPSSKEYVCGGGEPTIADFAIFPWIRCIDAFYGAKEFVAMDSYENVVRWCKLLEDRPAVKRGLRVNGFSDDAVVDRHSPAVRAVQVDPGFSQLTPRLLSTLETKV